MITIIFAPPRTGKTCFMTHMGNMQAFNRERNKLMQKEILQKQQNGFKNIKTIPIHCVSANYDITFKRFMIRKIKIIRYFHKLPFLSFFKITN